MLAVLKKQFQPRYLFVHIILLGGALILVYPIVFLLMASLFTKPEYNSSIIGFFPIAKNPSLNNLKYLIFAANDKEAQTYYINGLLRTGYATVCCVLTSLLAGFVFARLRFKGRDALFMFLLGTQMIPPLVSLLPTYLELVRFPFANGNFIFTGGKGLFDTFWVYILLNGPAIYIIGTFLVKQSIEQIPIELDEAAKADGAGITRLIFQIILPLQKPVLAFVAIKVSIDTWNDWTVPFFYTNKGSLQTLASGLSKLTSFVGMPGLPPNIPLILTLSLMLTLPSILLFFIFQNLIIQGLANTGIKG